MVVYIFIYNIFVKLVHFRNDEIVHWSFFFVRKLKIDIKGLKHISFNKNFVNEILHINVYMYIEQYFIKGVSIYFKIMQFKFGLYLKLW